MPHESLPEGFILRPGVPADANSFYELDNICFPPQVAFSMSLFRYHLKDRASINLVVEKNAGAIHELPLLAGFIVAHVFGKSGQIVTMDVHPDYRKKGIGTVLLDECEKAMREKGAKESLLQVSVENEPAIALYKKNKYRPIGIMRGYYQYPPPNGTDAIYMEKVFK